MRFKSGRLLAIVAAFVVTVGLTIGLFLWIAAGEIYDYEDSFAIETDSNAVDVVLCLAGGKGRIAAAVDLWHRIKLIRESQLLTSPVLFLSGVGPKANLETLAEQGVPKELWKTIKPDEIVFENVSENTFGNAQIFASFARQKKWKNVVLVTAGYHMKRALSIFKKTVDPGTKVRTVTVDAAHFDRNQWRQDFYSVRVTFMEYLKWIFYRYNY